MVIRLNENDLMNIATASQNKIERPAPLPIKSEQGQTEFKLKGFIFKPDSESLDKEDAYNILTLLGDIEIEAEEVKDGAIFLNNYNQLYFTDLEENKKAYQIEPDALREIDFTEYKQQYGKGLIKDKGRKVLIYNEGELKKGDIGYLVTTKKNGKIFVTDSKKDKFPDNKKDFIDANKFEINQAVWSGKKGYVNIDIVKLYTPNKGDEIQWSDGIQDTKYADLGMESNLVEVYWQSSVLSRQEVKVLQGKMKASDRARAQIENKYLEANYLPSKRLFTKFKHVGDFLSEEQQLKIARWADDNNIDATLDYFEILVTPAFTFASNWGAGLQFIAKVAVEMKDALNEQAIDTVFETILLGNKLADNNTLNNVYKRLKNLVQNNLPITQESLLKDQPTQKEEKVQQALNNKQNKLTHYILSRTIKDYMDAYGQNKKSDIKKLITYYSDKFLNDDKKFRELFKNYLDKAGVTNLPPDFYKKITFTDPALLKNVFIRQTEEEFLEKLKQYINKEKEFTKDETVDAYHKRVGKNLETNEILQKGFVDLWTKIASSNEESKEMFNEAVDTGRESEVLAKIDAMFRKQPEVADQYFKKYLDKIGVTYPKDSEEVSVWNKEIQLISAHNSSEVDLKKALEEYFLTLDNSEELEEGLLYLAYIIGRQFNDFDDVRTFDPKNIEIIKYAKEITKDSEDAVERFKLYLDDLNTLNVNYLILDQSKLTTRNKEVQKLARKSRGDSRSFVNLLKEYFETIKV